MLLLHFNLKGSRGVAALWNNGNKSVITQIVIEQDIKLAEIIPQMCVRGVKCEEFAGVVVIAMFDAPEERERDFVRLQFHDVNTPPRGDILFREIVPPKPRNTDMTENGGEVLNHHGMRFIAVDFARSLVKRVRFAVRDDFNVLGFLGR